MSSHYSITAVLWQPLQQGLTVLQQEREILPGFIRAVARLECLERLVVEFPYRYHGVDDDYPATMVTTDLAKALPKIRHIAALQRWPHYCVASRTGGDDEKPVIRIGNAKQMSHYGCWPLGIRDDE
jgi:hypothetical protein